MTNAGSYLSSNDPRIVVGLGAARKGVRSIEVRWPSGRVQTISNPAIDRIHAHQRSIISERTSEADPCKQEHASLLTEGYPLSLTVIMLWNVLAKSQRSGGRWARILFVMKTAWAGVKSLKTVSDRAVIVFSSARVPG